MKMLMEIDSLLMRGSWVMTMVMSSPSRTEGAPVEQLRRSPRLVLPRFRLKTATLRLESFLLNFFQAKTHHIVEDGHRRAIRGAHEAGGAPPTLVDRVWAPSGTFIAQ